MQIDNLLKILRAIVRDPKSLDRVLDYESEKKRDVASKYGLSQGLPSIDLLDLFPDFKETVEQYSFLEGTSTVMDIALLKALARRYPNCNYLEIGTWRGESVSNVADVAVDCTTISLSEKEMKDLSYSEGMIKAHGFFSKKLHNVNHIYHNSRDFDFSSLGKGFDLIFIDGDHSYESVKSDTQKVFPLLKDDRSVVVWHDYGFSPERVRWSVLAGMLDGCPNERRKEIYHISNTLCAICIKGRFPTNFVTFPQMPNKRFKIELSAAKT